MKTYSIVIVTCFIMVAFFAKAQNSADYKHPFSKGTQASVLKGFEVSSSGYSTSDNYKHPQYRVRSVVSKVQIPDCCSKVRVSSFNYPNYKHPLNKLTGKTCGLEYFCSERVRLSCCL